MSSEFAGHTYLIPGGSGGIGLCSAQKLAKLGANVIILARNGEKLAAAVQSLPPGAHEGIVFDVCGIDAIENLIAGITQRRGNMAGMLYCVGNGDMARLRDLDYSRLHTVMLANFYGFIQFARALASNKNKNDRLAIVAVSSLASTSTEKYYTAYTSSKAALEAAVSCLALELCKRNTTINCIRPGVVRTERVDSLSEVTGDIEKKIIRSGFQPMGLIPVEDVADLAVYLLGNSAKYINGASIAINGGAVC